MLFFVSRNFRPETRFHRRFVARYNYISFSLTRSSPFSVLCDSYRSLPSCSEHRYQKQVQGSRVLRLHVLQSLAAGIEEGWLLNSGVAKSLAVGNCSPGERALLLRAICRVDRACPSRGSCPHQGVSYPLRVTGSVDRCPGPVRRTAEHVNRGQGDKRSWSPRVASSRSGAEPSRTGPGPRPPLLPDLPLLY